MSSRCQRRMLVWLALFLLPAQLPPQTVHAAERILSGGGSPSLVSALGRTSVGILDASGLSVLFDAAPARAAMAPAHTHVPRSPIPLQRTGTPFSAPEPPPARLKSEQPPRRLKRTRHPLVVPTPKATQAYRRTFRILMAHPEKTDRYDELILKYSARYDIDPRLLKAIIAAESEFNPYAKSPKGARGLMQLMPTTASEFGVPAKLLHQPEHNIRAGAAYLAYLFRTAWKRFKLRGVRYQDSPLWVVQRVIAAYNAGPRFLTRSHWYRETKLYVRKVLLFYQSKVTDIRRNQALPFPKPEFRMIRSTSGSLY